MRLTYAGGVPLGRLNSSPSTCSRTAGSPATAATAASSIAAHTSGTAPTAGVPTSAMGGRTAQPDFFNRDTASSSFSGPTSSRTIATGFRRSPRRLADGERLRRAGRGLGARPSLLLGPSNGFMWPSAQASAYTRPLRAGITPAKCQFPTRVL